MSENHKLERILAEIGCESVPPDVRQLAEEITDEFRRGLAERPVAADSMQSSVRLVPDVPTDQADGDSRETRPNKQPPGRRHVPRRFLAMFQYKTVRWAVVAAAVVIAFVGVGSWRKLNNGKAGVVFADVIKGVLSARTVQFKGVSTVKLPGQESRIVTTDTIITEQPNRMRQTVSSGDSSRGSMVMIWDYSEGRCLTLDPEAKQAMIMEMHNMPAEQKSQNVLEQFRQMNPETATPIGEKVIDGRLTQGFKVGATPAFQMLVWADPQTGLPVEIETTLKMGMLPATTMTMTDFVWDQEVDESLVSLTPPAGYEVQTYQVNLGPASEQDLINALKTLAEMRGGTFPPGLDLNSAMKGLGKQLKNKSPDDPAQRKDGTEKIVELTTAVSRAWMFINDPKSGEDFHYAGKGVAKGQAETPVLWYRPKDSTTYRVIDADLTVRDVAEADLPTVPSKVLGGATAPAADQLPQP